MGRKAGTKKIAKKSKVTTEEELGLSGTETAYDLYNLYIKVRNSTNDKMTAKVKALWVKKYNEEKKNGRK